MGLSRKKSKFIFFVYQFGKLDFVGMNLRQAKEMSESPEGHRQPYAIERWVLVDGKYQFDKSIPWGGNP